MQAKSTPFRPVNSQPPKRPVIDRAAIFVAVVVGLRFRR
jgi:hypothetical protein